MIQGFRSFWAYYVNGFRPEYHCQACFKGKPVKDFCGGVIQSRRRYELDEMDSFDYVYICGVGTGPRRTLAQKNFHLPLRYVPDETFTVNTYNGYVVTVKNAAEVPIPPLPDGWNGRDRETTRCKNFQFGVAYFGQP